MATCSANMMDVPESQRLITVSLSKIAASRSQKGGINLHKNLLVATVLTKARAAYMIQHITANKQRAAMAAAPPSSAPTSSSSSPACVEMKEQKAEPVPASSATSSPPPSSSAAPSSSFHSSAPSTPQSVTPRAETSSVPEGAADSCMQVAECEDKENTPPPPPPSSPCRDAPPSSSSDCEKRLQGEPCVDSVKDISKQQALSARPSVSHSQHHSNSNNTRDYVSRPSSTCCLLKRRRAMDRDHENVSAPKVRIVEARVSLDSTTTSASSTPEPMQCDSPQISNLVNIFNTSFSGLSGAPGNGELSVRSVGQSILSSVSVSSHKLSDNLTCAKEIKAGLDSLHQPLVLSV